MWYHWSKITADNFVSVVLYRHSQKRGEGRTEKAGGGFMNLYQSRWENTGWENQIFSSWHSDMRMRVTDAGQDKMPELFQLNLLQFSTSTKLFLYSLFHLRKRVRWICLPISAQVTNIVCFLERLCRSVHSIGSIADLMPQVFFLSVFGCWDGFFVCSPLSIQRVGKKINKMK